MSNILSLTSRDILWGTHQILSIILEIGMVHFYIIVIFHHFKKLWKLSIKCVKSVTCTCACIKVTFATLLIYLSIWNHCFPSFNTSLPYHALWLICNSWRCFYMIPLCKCIFDMSMSHPHFILIPSQVETVQLYCFLLDSFKMMLLLKYTQILTQD